MLRHTTAALLLALAGASLVGAGDPAAAAKNMARIEIGLRTAEAQYALAVRFIRDYERQQERERERAARDPKYRPIGSVTRLSGQLNMINHKYAALGKIGTLLNQKLEAAKSRPLGEQLRLVEEELRKAEARSKDDPGASTLGHVTLLIGARARIQIAMSRGRP